MTNPKPPRWLKPVNKVMIAMQKLGIPTGPPMTPFTLDSQLYTVAGLVFRFDPV